MNYKISPSGVFFKRDFGFVGKKKHGGKPPCPKYIPNGTDDHSVLIGYVLVVLAIANGSSMSQDSGLRLLAVVPLAL